MAGWEDTVRMKAWRSSSSHTYLLEKENKTQRKKVPCLRSHSCKCRTEVGWNSGADRWSRVLSLHTPISIRPVLWAYSAPDLCLFPPLPTEATCPCSYARRVAALLADWLTHCVSAGTSSTFFLFFFFFSLLQRVV